jgi:hypothetical protein
MAPCLPVDEREGRDESRPYQHGELNIRMIGRL